MEIGDKRWLGNAPSNSQFDAGHPADLAAEIKAAIDLTGDKVLELRAGYGLNVTKDYTNQGWYAGVGLRF